MLYEVQNRNVFSLRLKVCVLLVWRTLSGRVFQSLGATIMKARSPNFSLDRGKNKSKFDADLRTVGRVESVKTGCIKLEMYDGALPLRGRWTSRQILYCILHSTGIANVYTVSEKMAPKHVKITLLIEND